MAGGHPESLQGGLLRRHTHCSAMGPNSRPLCAEGALCSDWSVIFLGKLYYLIDLYIINFVYRRTQPGLRGWDRGAAEGNEELYTPQL